MQSCTSLRDLIKDTLNERKKYKEEVKSSALNCIRTQTNLHQTLLVSDRFSSLRSNIFGSLSLLNKNGFPVPVAVIILLWQCQLRQSPKTEAALEAHADQFFIITVKCRSNEDEKRSLMKVYHRQTTFIRHYVNWCTDNLSPDNLSPDNSSPDNSSLTNRPLTTRLLCMHSDNSSPG